MGPPRVSSVKTTDRRARLTHSASQKTGLPRVSLCTITYNRSGFLPLLQAHILAQSYPRDLLEWIILDDSDDSSSPFEPNLVCGLEIRYERLEERLDLGIKRNLSHSFCTGDIIIYMDDDDYYPPTRVAHAVERLQASTALIAGSTVLPIFFLSEKQLWIAGPYGGNHATAGTFAFKRELLALTSYDETKKYAEERSFLKDYTIPMVQLDPCRTIVCMAHGRNTVDKNRLKAGGQSPRCRKAAESENIAVKKQIGPLLPAYEALLPAKPDPNAVAMYMPTSRREPPNLHVVIPLYNSEEYILDCLESVRRQKDCNVSVTIVDDKSSDSSRHLASQFISCDPRFRLFSAVVNGGAMQNMIRCVNMAPCRPDDVIVCLDSDDQLVGDDSLSLIAEAYAQTDCWLSYGSFVTSCGERRGAPYDRRTIRDNLFRVAPWRASHLKTFRYDLWNHLSDQDLRDDQSQYFRGAADLAFMIPMLELAGSRQCYIHDAVYLYNIGNTQGVSGSLQDIQCAEAIQIRGRQGYSPLQELSIMTGSEIRE